MIDFSTIQFVFQIRRYQGSWWEVLVSPLKRLLTTKILRYYTHFYNIGFMRTGEKYEIKITKNDQECYLCLWFSLQLLVIYSWFWHHQINKGPQFGLMIPHWECFHRNHSLYAKSWHCRKCSIYCENLESGVIRLKCSLYCENPGFWMFRKKCLILDEISKLGRLD